MSSTDYGVPDERERTEMLDILGHAFAVEPADSVGWFSAAGHENLRVLRERGGVVGTCILVPMGQFFGGRSVPMTGIAGVGVRPDAHRRGVATELMRQAMIELAREGTALSALYASTLSLYHRVGYESAGSLFEAQIVPRDIEIRDSGFTLETFTDSHRDEIMALYREHGARFDGFVDRGSYVWGRMFDMRFGVAPHGMLFRDGDRLAGYILYRKHASPGQNQRIAVSDLMGTTAATMRRIWSFLRDLSTCIVDEITVPTAPSDPAYLIHPNPQFKVSLTENWMLRVVDVESALTCRGYPRELETVVDLDIDDATLPDNGGPLRLSVRDGSGHVERGGDSRGRVRVDARGLAALYSGFQTAETLALLGRLEGERRDLERLSAAFAGPAPWMREMF